MDCLIVRTKLQALIALTLIDKGIIIEGFQLIKLYQYSNNEDDNSVYQAYDRVSQHSGSMIEIIQSKGFFRTYWRCSLALLKVYLTRGKVFFAGVDFYPFALAAKQFRGIHLCTFDDGLANTLETSKYYSSEPLPPKGIKRAILRWIFPSGSQDFLRKKIQTHYTIFRDKRNIVDKNKLVPVDFDWKVFFDQKDFEKIPKNVKSVLLGTVYREVDPEYKSIAMQVISQIDLYLPHPRDKEFQDSNKFLRLNAPAESVLIYLASNNNCNFKVFHFNSTVASSLADWKLSNLSFLDICSDLNWRKFLSTFDTVKTLND